MKNTVTISPHSPGLFNIQSASGFTCLGFEVCERRAVALACELAALGYSIDAPAAFGTVERYEQLEVMQERARLHHERTGHRFYCELEPALLLLEGRRVEATRKDGSVTRFKVGKSTGWIPYHLALRNSRSRGGSAISRGEFVSFRQVA